MAQDLGDRAAAARRRDQRAAAARTRLVGSLSELADVGVRAVRLQYADLHGICRGKLIPISAFPHVAEEGMGFVEAIMTVDLRHNVVAGFEHGFPDLLARPDLNTLVPAAVGGGRRRVPGRSRGSGHARAARARLPGRALKRVLAQFAELGVSPVVGPELEFYLMEPDPDRPARLAPVRRSGQRGVHGRRHGRPEGDAGADARRGGRARARRDRRRPRVRPQPVRDQPAPLGRARLVRPRVPVPGDGQGDGRARRAARDVHGQAVQRRRGLGVPPARVAGRRRRCERRRGRGRRRTA